MSILDLLFESPAWMQDAACATADGVDWFPADPATAGPAKALCDECPARAQCLEFALATGERFGVWGGLDELERRALTQAAPPDLCGTYPRGAHRHEKAHEPLCEDCLLARGAYYRLRRENGRVPGPIDFRDYNHATTTSTTEVPMPTITAPERDALEVTTYVADMAGVLSRTEGHPDKLVRDLRKLAVQAIQALSTATTPTNVSALTSRAASTPPGGASSPKAGADTPTVSRGAGARRSAERLAELGVTAADVRTWAAENGVDCAPNGIVPRAVVDAFETARTVVEVPA